MMKIIDACKRRFSSLSKEEEKEVEELGDDWWETISYNPFLEYDKAKREAIERKRLREAKNLRKKKTFPKTKRRMARTKRTV